MRQQKLASIKPCRAGDIVSGGRGGGERTTKWAAGKLDVKCQSLEGLIWTAYLEYADGKPWPYRAHPPISELASMSMKGTPAWTRSDRYTIEAKAGGMEMTEGTMTESGLHFDKRIKRPALMIFAMDIDRDRMRQLNRQAQRDFAPLIKSTEEQFEAGKRPVEVLVIDHTERVPTSD